MSYIRGKRVVGRWACDRIFRAAAGYSLLFHAMDVTEERKYSPLGCHIRKLVLYQVTSAC